MARSAVPVIRIEHSIEIESSAARVFETLTDPSYIARFAGGIEGAEVTKRPSEGLLGAELDIVTTGGTTLHARVEAFEADRRIVVVDERGVRSTWAVTPAEAGRVRLSNTIEGPIPTGRAAVLRFDADVKFQALQRFLET